MKAWPLLIALLTLSCAHQRPANHMEHEASLVVEQKSLFSLPSVAKVSSEGRVEFAYHAHNGPIIVRTSIAPEDVRRLAEQAAALHQVSFYPTFAYSTIIDWQWQGKSGWLTCNFVSFSADEYPVLNALGQEIRDYLHWDAAEAVYLATAANQAMEIGNWASARYGYFKAAMTAGEWNRKRLRREQFRDGGVYGLMLPYCDDSDLLDDETPEAGARRMKQHWLEYQAFLFDLQLEDGAYVMSILPPPRWTR